MLGVILLAASLAAPPKLPPGVTCDDIRSHVARYGRVRVILWARVHGFSEADIREAEKCLK